MSSSAVEQTQAELIGQGLHQLRFGDEPAGDGRLAEELAGVLGLAEDFLELNVIDVAQVDEDLAEPAAGGAGRLAGLGRRRLVLGRGHGRLAGGLRWRSGLGAGGAARPLAWRAATPGLAAGAAGFWPAGGGRCSGLGSAGGA